MLYAPIEMGTAKEQLSASLGWLWKEPITKLLPGIK